MTILCTICMRSGSKGLKNKNLIKINNKYLMEYTINQAKKSKLFDHISVSTDSIKISNLAKKFGIISVFKREKKLSGDKVGKVEVIKNLLFKTEKKNNCKYDVICDLDVTSPLRYISDIKKSYKKFKKKIRFFNYTSLPEKIHISILLEKIKRFFCCRKK